MRHIVSGLLAMVFLFAGSVQAQAPKGWVQGKGYGWIWGPDDEIGALNALTPATVTAALKIPTQDKVDRVELARLPALPHAHVYLLVQQGVYIGEFHYLEDLARDKVYEFLYVNATNKIRGTAAGFTMRPVAIR
jgi:hypothetical protein